MEADRVGGQETYQAKGNAEGDYYGLRHWQPGDSRRWIHWRTSARLGKLAVRQFEQQRDRDIAVLLDLYLSPESLPAEEAALEVAVSMAATVIEDLGRQTGIQLMLACSGSSMHCWAASSSHLIAREIIHSLATVEGGPGVHLSDCISEMKEELRFGSQVVVISTRPENPQAARQLAVKPVWIDCSSQQLAEYFQLSAPSIRENLGPADLVVTPIDEAMSAEMVTSHQDKE
jgi:uncharacterized protein (DUF58 family)